MTAPAALKVQGLTVKFGDFTAVDNISFEVAKGEIFGFLGANGAGKTTVIRAACGLLLPTAGRIETAGTDVSAGLKAVKSKTGYMSQKFTLYPDLTAGENLSFAGALRKIAPRELQSRIKELLDFTGFAYPLDRMVNTLPGGEKQIIALCACLLHQPELVFLDEPTAGVSPASRARFWRLINRLASEGKTVFVTTHYMDEAEQCGRISLMQSGRIIALDSPANLKRANFPEPLYEVTPGEGFQGEIGESLKTAGAGPVSACGMRWHVAVSDEAAWKRFESGNNGKFSARTIAPSLEDVFLRLVGGGK